MNRFARVIAIAALTAGPSFAQDNVLDVPSNVMKEMVRTKVDPVYPQSAIADSVGGVVALHAIISKYGQITKLDVIKGPEALRPSALEAVKQWTFVPYIVKQQPTAVSTTILIQYNPYMYGPGTTPGPTVALLSEDSSGVAGMGGMGGMPGPVPFMHTPTNLPNDVKMMNGGMGNAALATVPVRLSDGVMKGNILSRVEPKYPAIAKAAKVQGAVLLYAQISESGSVESLSLISGPPMLVTAAIAAVQQWKWKPYILNGKPTKVDTIVTVNFSLQK